MAPKPLPASADQAARDIKGMSDSFHRHYRSFAPKDDEAEPVLKMGLGWGIRLCRTAEAIVTLHRHRYSQESSGLVRSMMEHALKMRWLVERREDALAAIEFGHRKYQRVLKDSWEKGSWDLDDLDDRDLPPSDLDMPKPDEHAAYDHMEELVRQYAPDLSWYAAYRLECSTSHATYLSGAAYHDETRIAEPGYGLLWNPFLRGTPLRVTSVWLLVGLGQFEDIANVPTAFQEVLNTIGARFESEGAALSE